MPEPSSRDLACAVFMFLDPPLQDTNFSTQLFLSESQTQSPNAKPYTNLGIKLADSSLWVGLVIQNYELPTVTNQHRAEYEVGTRGAGLLGQVTCLHEEVFHKQEPCPVFLPGRELRLIDPYKCTLTR